jgi:hypothetical protein
MVQTLSLAATTALSVITVLVKQLLLFLAFPATILVLWVTPHALYAQLVPHVPSPTTVRWYALTTWVQVSTAIRLQLDQQVVILFMVPVQLESTNIRAQVPLQHLVQKVTHVILVSRHHNFVQEVTTQRQVQ